MKLPCFLHDPTNVGNLISGSSAFSKPSLYNWKLSVHILLKPGLSDFEHNPASIEMSTVVWQFEHSLELPFFGIGMNTDFFQPCGPAEFSEFDDMLKAALSHHPLLRFLAAQLEFHHLHWLCLQWCFPRPAWLHTPGCPALGQWPQHRGYPGD